MQQILDDIAAGVRDDHVYKVRNLVRRYQHVFPHSYRTVLNWCETQQIQGAFKMANGHEWLISGADFKTFVTDNYKEHV